MRLFLLIAAVLAGPALAWADEAAPPPAAAPPTAAAPTPSGEAPKPSLDALSPEQLNAYETSLAQQLANPVANLVNVPFQNNYNCCFGPRGGGQWVLNIQPVIPVSISRDWNLITRTIVPVVNQGVSFPGTSNNFGFGDVVQTFFFSPKRPVAGLFIGVGPVLVYPLANANLGTQKWSAGPSFAVLRQQGPWTAGLLANWVWSFAGPSGRAPVNLTFLQPFVTYTTPTATSFTLTTETALNWTTHGYTVPVNFTVGQVLKLGNQLIQVSGGPRVFLTTPQGGPGWGARLTGTLLFPRR